LKEALHGHAHSYQRHDECQDFHRHSLEEETEETLDVEQEHGHSHSHKKEKKEKSHGHNHDDKHHGHSHASHVAVLEEEPDAVRTCFPCLAWCGDGEGKFDLNIRAVLLHYLGDALSSFCLVIAGLLLHFFPYNKKDDSNMWTLYLDPLFRYDFNWIFFFCIFIVYLICFDLIFSRFYFLT
jgi:hypothetical protein